MSIKDEFEFINQIAPKNTYQTALIKGIGDDAALIGQDPMSELVICLDTMVEGIHFLESTMRPSHIGHKALAANISDIAAMGGIPTFYLVSIATPGHWSKENLLEIFEGMRELGDQYQMDLIGGDTVSTNDSLVLTVTVIGKVEKGKHLLRSNSRPGDIIFVSGIPGESAAGLSLLLEKGIDFPFNNDEVHLIKRHQLPQPRVELGSILANVNHRVALNDISDGVASEAHEIAAESNVTLVIEKDRVPYSSFIKNISRKQQLDWFFYGGEDFELLGTIDKSYWKDIQLKAKAKGIPVCKIGYVSEGPASVLLKEEDQLVAIEKKGYNHFKKNR